ncbi:thioredoxin domain-containing protein, partial [Staphylococcus aureus]|nr:thioredoxin domain-containing protein [Staphylococcus aureus]
MDISVIDATKVNTETGLHIGERNAPVKMIEFINVRCPYCRKWFEESEELLAQSVKSGKVERIIKLFDKEKESLQRGNVMHHYIDYSAPEQALSALHKMFAT